MYDCFLLFVLMRFYGTLIHDYVYVVMFDYIVQVGELLEFLCVDLHNQCYFIFYIVVHNGAEHILLLDFLWVHPNLLD